MTHDSHMTKVLYHYDTVIETDARCVFHVFSAADLVGEEKSDNDLNNDNTTIHRSKASRAANETSLLYQRSLKADENEL